MYNIKKGKITMKELLSVINDNFLQIILIIILGFILYQSRRLTSDICINLDKVGVDGWKKLMVIRKANFDYYILNCFIIIILVRMANYISSELFIALLIAILATYGIKLTKDISENKSEKTDIRDVQEEKQNMQNQKEDKK